MLNVFQATKLFSDSSSQDPSQDATPSLVSIPPNRHDSVSEERFHIDTHSSWSIKLPHVFVLCK